MMRSLKIFTNKGMDNFVSYGYNFLHKMLIEYPVVYNINYLWNIGFLLAFFLILQIVTGIILTMFYTCDITVAFTSIDYIMREVTSGWLFRYLHLNGASILFILLYMHILKAIYYNSYSTPRHTVWTIGFLIYLLLIIVAFSGYLLPWGQISYWAALVITSLITVFQGGLGQTLLTWVWGGFILNDATLHRFFALHYLLPFIIIVLIFFHLLALHSIGSNNPLGIFLLKIDTIPFFPYSYLTDFFSIILFSIGSAFILFFYPETFNHFDNYNYANPMITPEHIQPEWYFLPYYTVLRTIPNKIIGIFFLFVFIVIIGLLPILDNISFIKVFLFQRINAKFFWFFFFNLIFLSFIGACPPLHWYLFFGLFFLHIYFLTFLFFLPFSRLFNFNL